MRKREALAGGQIEIESDVTRDRVEVRIVVSRAPAPQKSRFPWLRPDPVVDYAWRSLRHDVVEMIRAQLFVLPHHIGEQPDTDPDTGNTVIIRNTGNLLSLLEGASREEFGTLLRAPDVVNGMVEVMTGRKHAQLKRLRTILQRHTASRRGAPIKPAGESGSLATAFSVAEWEVAISEPFDVARQLRRERARSIPARLIKQFGLDPNEAAILATSKSRQHAAHQLVAYHEGRTVEAVKRAAARGAKHPDFRPAT